MPDKPNLSFIFVLFFCLLMPIALRAQTSEQTGKSYDLSEIKRPAATAPQFPSPVTFTDITAQTGIDFRHSASPTVVKYLPETMGAGVGLFDFD